MATLKPVQTDKYGLAKVSDGRYVNPNYATPESQAAMLRNANPQGFSPYTTKDAQGNDIRVNPINQAVGFSGYGFSGEGGVSNVNSIQGLNLQIPTTISSSVLANNEAPIQIPQTPFSTQADRITGRTNAILQSDDLEQKAEQQRLEQQSKLQSTEQKQQSLLQRIGLVKQEETKKGNEEFGLDLLKEKRKNAVKGMRESIIRQQEEFAAVEKESMLTDVQKSQRRSAIRQKYALEQNQLQLDYDLSNMDIVAAQATIDDRIKILTEPMYAELELTQNVYNQISQSLSKAEDRVWNIAINNIENAVAEKNKIGEFAKQVAANGADAATITRVTNAKTMGEAVQAAGQFAGDVLERQIKQAQLAKLQTDAKKAMQEISTPPTATGELAKAQAKGNIDLISGLASDKYLSSAVGPNTFARTSLFNAFTGGKSNFIAGVEQLSSQLSLDSLIRAKANGATFGALSDSELRILSASASKLGTWAIKDKDGNVIGYKTSEAEFKKEMDKIINFAKLDYLIKGGSVEDVGAQQLPDGTIWVANSDGSFTQLYP